jgi:DNA-directed RNA polymerase subunit beta'
LNAGRQEAKAEDKDNQRIIKISGQLRTKKPGAKKKYIFTDETRNYIVPSNQGIWVKQGDLIVRGQQLTEGHLDLKELYRLAGKEAVQRYILKEVQNIYTSQGEGINDKHIEIIIKQMFSRVKVKDPGDSDLLVGEVVEKSIFLLENDKVREKKSKPATAIQLLMGISKVSLTTESWLSAASFQETARVLIGASIAGKKDRLKGLKENVIIGKLIPAGTGFRQDWVEEEEGGRLEDKEDK